MAKGRLIAIILITIFTLFSAYAEQSLLDKKMFNIEVVKYNDDEDKDILESSVSMFFDYKNNKTSIRWAVEYLNTNYTDTMHLYINDSVTNEEKWNLSVDTGENSNYTVYYNVTFDGIYDKNNTQFNISFENPESVFVTGFFELQDYFYPYIKTQQDYYHILTDSNYKTTSTIQVKAKKNQEISCEDQGFGHFVCEFNLIDRLLLINELYNDGDFSGWGLDFISDNLNAITFKIDSETADPINITAINYNLESLNPNGMVYSYTFNESNGYDLGKIKIDTSGKVIIDFSEFNLFTNVTLFEKLQGIKPFIMNMNFDLPDVVFNNTASDNMNYTVYNTSDINLTYDGYVGFKDNDTGNEFSFYLDGDVENDLHTWEISRPVSEGNAHIELRIDDPQTNLWGTDGKIRLVLFASSNTNSFELLNYNTNIAGIDLDQLNNQETCVATGNDTLTKLDALTHMYEIEDTDNNNLYEFECSEPNKQYNDFPRKIKVKFKGINNTKSFEYQYKDADGEWFKYPHISYYTKSDENKNDVIISMFIGNEGKIRYFKGFENDWGNFIFYNETDMSGYIYSDLNYDSFYELTQFTPNNNLQSVVYYNSYLLYGIETDVDQGFGKIISQLDGESVTVKNSLYASVDLGGFWYVFPSEYETFFRYNERNDHGMEVTLNSSSNNTFLVGFEDNNCDPFNFIYVDNEVYDLKEQYECVKSQQIGKYQIVFPLEINTEGTNIIYGRCLNPNYNDTETQNCYSNCSQINKLNYIKNESSRYCVENLECSISMDNWIYFENNSCEDSCPSETLQNNATKRCVQNCAILNKFNYVDGSYKECVSTLECDNRGWHLIPFTAECVEECPSNTVLDEYSNTCILDCAEQGKLNYEHDGTLECVTHNECIDAGAFDFVENGECVNTCPVGTVEVQEFCFLKGYMFEDFEVPRKRKLGFYIKEQKQNKNYIDLIESDINIKVNPKMLKLSGKGLEEFEYEIRSNLELPVVIDGYADENSLYELEYNNSILNNNYENNQWNVSDIQSITSSYKRFKLKMKTISHNRTVNTTQLHLGTQSTIYEFSDLNITKYNDDDDKDINMDSINITFYYEENKTNIQWNVTYTTENYTDNLTVYVNNNGTETKKWNTIVSLEGAVPQTIAYNITFNGICDKSECSYKIKFDNPETVIISTMSEFVSYYFVRLNSKSNADQEHEPTRIEDEIWVYLTKNPSVSSSPVLGLYTTYSFKPIERIKIKTYKYTNNSLDSSIVNYLSQSSGAYTIAHWSIDADPVPITSVNSKILEYNGNKIIIRYTINNNLGFIDFILTDKIIIDYSNYKPVSNQTIFNKLEYLYPITYQTATVQSCLKGISVSNLSNTTTSCPATLSYDNYIGTKHTISSEIYTTSMYIEGDSHGDSSHLTAQPNSFSLYFRPQLNNTLWGQDGNIRLVMFIENTKHPHSVIAGIDLAQYNVPETCVADNSDTIVRSDPLIYVYNITDSDNDNYWQFTCTENTRQFQSFPRRILINNKQVPTEKGFDYSRKYSLEDTYRKFPQFSDYTFIDNDYNEVMLSVLLNSNDNDLLLRGESYDFGNYVYFKESDNTIRTINDIDNDGFPTDTILNQPLTTLYNSLIHYVVEDLNGGGYISPMPSGETVIYSDPTNVVLDSTYELATDYEVFFERFNDNDSEQEVTLTSSSNDYYLVGFEDDDCNLDYLFVDNDKIDFRTGDYKGKFECQYANEGGKFIILFPLYIKSTGTTINYKSCPTFFDNGTNECIEDCSDVNKLNYEPIGESNECRTEAECIAQNWYVNSDNTDCIEICPIEEIAINGYCTETDCATDDDCKTGYKCINGGQLDSYCTIDSTYEHYSSSDVPKLTYNLMGTSLYTLNNNAGAIISITIATAILGLASLIIGRSMKIIKF